MYEDSDQFAQLNPGKQQVALLPRLMQVVTSMHHIDELLQWLAQAFVYYFNVQVAVFWTNHVSQAGQLAVQLRTIARQDPSLSDQILVNDQMQYVAQRLMNERVAHSAQPVEVLFSHYQALLLKRYGLHYWGTFFTSRNALLPPRADIFNQGEASAFLAMTTLCFFKQSPPYNFVATFSQTLDKAMELAETHNLLLRAPGGQMPITPFPVSQVPFPYPSPQTPPPFVPQELPFPVQSPALSLLQLIPHRKQDPESLVSSNPFSSAAVISDKKARRLHTAIDGRSTVAELCATTGFNQQEIQQLLRVLWDQQRIEVSEPGGKGVNLALFLNNY